MSEMGHKQAFHWAQWMSAIHPKADIRVARRHVCFGPQADIRFSQSRSKFAVVEKKLPAPA